jgi:general transcription factor 3C polypeptide 3 (transcription factor C subunit 4)
MSRTVSNSGHDDDSERPDAPSRRDDEVEMSYPDPSSLVHTPYPTLTVDHVHTGVSENENVAVGSDLEDVLEASPPSSVLYTHRSHAPESVPTQLRNAAQDFYNQAGPPGRETQDEGESDWAPSNTQAETDLDTGLDTEFDDDTDMGDVPDGEASGHRTSRKNTRPKADDSMKKKRRGWRQFLKGTEFEHLGRAKREPAAPKRPVPRRDRNYVDPGRDFKQMLSKASQEFLAENYDAAADFARAAVEANPEVFAAHSLLSEILRKQGKNEDSIRVLTWGAHVAKQPTVWLNILERILELLEDAPSEALIREALDCAKEGMRLKSAATPELEYLFQRHRFQLFKQLGDTTATRKSCKHILKRWPNDIQMCCEFAEICATWKDTTELKLAQKLYDDALTSLDDPSGLEPEDDPWRHVMAYLEVVTLLGEPSDAIAAGKRLSRWALGRKSQTFWDDWNDDDREFDIGDERRSEVPEFQAMTSPQDRSKYGAGLPIEIRIKFGKLRVNMGSSHYEEGSKHLQFLAVFEDSIEYYYDLYLQAATSLHAVGLLQDAARFFDTLRDVPDVIDEPVWMTMGTCYEGIGQAEDAIECFEEVTRYKEDNFGLAMARLAKLHEEAGNSDKARALCEEVINLGRRDLLRSAKVKAIPKQPRPRLKRTITKSAPEEPTNGLRSNPLPSPHAGIEGTFGEFQLERAETQPEQPITVDADVSRPPEQAKRRVADDGFSGVDVPSIKRPKPRRTHVLKKATSGMERQLLHFQDASSRIRANHAVVQLHWPAMKAGGDEKATTQWIESAENLLDDFRATKVFFPDENGKQMQLKISSHEQRIFTKIEAGLQNPNPPKDFQDISFHEWHQILAELALVHARNGEQEKCYKIVQDVLITANVFWQNSDLERISIAVALCCALLFNDGQYVVELGRKVINLCDARLGMAFQLFAASNRFIYGSNWFHAGPSQKFMHRTLKTADYLAMPSEMREQFDFAMQKGGLLQRLDKYSGEGNEVNANALLIYGHMVAVANHSFTSLPYYFRTLAMYPDDICVNLSIATMWVQNSMKRQTENRHFGIMQGLAFLYRYYELRTASGRACDCQEAEYNVARMWHNLGLIHLAMPAYEKVLELSGQVQEEWLANRASLGGESVDDDAEDFAKEAAFALQSIYALDGNDEAANAITEEWLVI